MTYTKNDGPNGFFFVSPAFFRGRMFFFWGGYQFVKFQWRFTMNGSMMGPESRPPLFSLPWDLIPMGKNPWEGSKKTHHHGESAVESYL